MEAFLSDFIYIYILLYSRFVIVGSESSLNKLKILFETYPNEIVSISSSVPFGRSSRMDTILTRRRGKTAWRETRFKSNADVASRITFLRGLPRRLLCVLPLARAFSVNHVSSKKEGKEERERGGRERKTPLSPANFKHL